MKTKENERLHISCVIPAYNEGKYIGRLLESISRAISAYHGGKDKIEVIVADNCSTDDTVEIAEQFNCRVVKEEKRIIAAVRNRGAANARGDILTFIDADSIIHPESFNKIHHCISKGKTVAGSTGIKMERMSVGIGVSYLMMLPMIWLTGIDTGLVFCKREDFQAIGGYNEKRPFAEDVEFLLALRNLGKKRGQHLSRLRSVKAICSTRKFDDHGEWHFLLMILRVIYGTIFSKKSVNKFSKKYWYGNQRSKEENDT